MRQRAGVLNLQSTGQIQPLVLCHLALAPPTNLWGAPWVCTQCRKVKDSHSLGLAGEALGEWGPHILQPTTTYPSLAVLAGTLLWPRAGNMKHTLPLAPAKSYSSGRSSDLKLPLHSWARSRSSNMCTSFTQMQHGPSHSQSYKGKVSGREVQGAHARGCKHYGRGQASGRKVGDKQGRQTGSLSTTGVSMGQAGGRPTDFPVVCPTTTCLPAAVWGINTWRPYKN